MNEKITVVIPTYNKAEYIEKTIESVFSQTYTDWEIVIADDCSSDNTEVVVKKYLSEKIRYFKHSTNWGPGATFNDGIKKANSEYVTLIASDDVLLPNHLELVMKEFKKNAVEVVFPCLKVIDEKNRNLKQTIYPPLDDKYKLLNHLFYKGNDVPSPCVAFKKNIFEKIPAFNPELILMHDYDLNVRLLIHCETVNLSEATVLYRRFSDNKNLSGDNNWYKVCHKAETKSVFDNYLNLQYAEMQKVFPQLQNCTEEEIIFKFLVDTCKHKTERLSSWAFERLISYLENNQNVFKDNIFNFQYKDYINLYKLHAKNIIGTTHKQKLFNDAKTIIKKLFGLR